MASPTLLSGTITHLDRISSTSGRMQHGNGQIRTDHTTTFRLDNQPAVFRGVADLGADEPATAAGYMKKGMFTALAVRNDSTGLVYGHSGIGMMLIGAGLMFVGLLMLSIGIGLFIMAGGGWVGMQGYRQREARTLLLGDRAGAMQRSVA